MKHYVKKYAGLHCNDVEDRIKNRIDNKTNFGSIDGDCAAAMRYTESRLTPISMEMLRDINKNTIPLKDNYDGEEKEPINLGGYFPCLLANGTFGIAVGMSSKVPSHNLHDIYNCCYHMIDKTINGEEYTINELIDIIQAPDFATGGTIIDMDGVKEGYLTGKGSFKIRGKYHFEDEKTLIIDEIPYKVNKQKLIENILDLTKDIKDKNGKKLSEGILSGIKDVKDESDREGMRIVITLKKDANPQIIVNKLLAKTDLQVSYTMNLRVLVDGRPQIVTLQDLLEKFLENSTQVLLNSTQYDYDKATKRLHLVQGLLRLFEVDQEDDSKLILDRVINIIKDSDNPDNEIINLGFTKEQSDYIQDIKLKALRKISVEKHREEEQQLIANIEKYQSILNDDVVLLTELKKIYQEVESNCADDRRTSISYGDGTISNEDLIKDEKIIITYTSDGSIKAVEEKEYKSQRRGGKGVKGAKIKEDEIIKFMFTANSKDDLLFLSNLGKCHVLKAYKIDKCSKNAKGKNIINYLSLEMGEKIVDVFNTKLDDKDSHLLFITKQGYIKKLDLNLLSNRSYTKVIKFKNEDDMLVKSLLVKDDNVLLVTKLGMSIRIDTTKIRSQGKIAGGVKGINLAPNDEVIDMTLMKNDKLLLTVTENGLSKLTNSNEFTVINRGGKGTKCHTITEKTGELVSVLQVNQDDKILIASNLGQITKISVDSIRICSRTSKGVKAITLNEGDKVSSVSLSLVNDEEEDIEEQNEIKEEE